MTKHYYDAEKYNPYQGLSYLTRRAAKLVTGHMDALFATRDMTFVQYAVLINIREKKAITASEICQDICHDTGALTRMIDQMDARGLLTRERSESDRRRIEMRLTPAGEETLSHLVRLLVDFWNDVLTDFSKEEADMLTDVLTRMTAKLSVMPKEKEKAA